MDRCRAALRADAGRGRGALIRIGLTAAHDDGDVFEYVAALREAGASAVVLPNDPARVAADLAGLHGILLSGGADVAPSAYGAAPHPRTVPADPLRDAYEIALVHAAREDALPTLAICRGLHVANVAFGGSLVQHVPDRVAETVPHRRAGVRGVIDTHVVDVASDALLAAVLGTTRLATSARHHQAVERVAADVRAVAWTSDGIVEALEARFPSPFWIGVQWHPESTLDDGGPSRALFAAFVAAARSARRA